MIKINKKLRGDWVKATRSVPAGFSLDAGAATTLSQGAGFKPSPASPMAANGFPNGEREREGGLKNSAFRRIPEP
jgi:hypothetical protein